MARTMGIYLGERVRELRVQRNMTQRELALSLGLKPHQNACVSRWEKNVIPVSKRNLLKMATAFGLSPYDAFPEAFKKPPLTLNEYQQAARRTMNPALNSEETFFHAIHGMAAEVGEIHSLYQKFYQGHEVDAEHIMKEVGDLLWMIAEFCTVHGWELADVAQKNIDKLLARYPDGFKVEQSLHRKEGDV